ncbi:hypothetical protein ABOM_003808 [Aspergillus bombycis]|uniref:Zn(2)-C6 fungal-type domain-containing protein n=1 Tax=Aspergillus bombycis TaxID=109264 RepID=A0A1F8A6E8_9EURO|nr:hypothetical protein ABOM_003808 [Aspergillus bombycis]OGM47306.1 hypothetical protein ABOM_003808 [Aspergillus bombycis]
MPSARPRRARRAPMACARCHARKVRCDVAFQGSPCTNCRLDGCECHERGHKESNTPRRQPHQHRASYLHSKVEKTRSSADTRSMRGSLSSILSHGPRHAKSENGIYSQLPFAYYGFLNTSTLQRLDETHIRFLEEKGCLHLPPRVVMDIFLQYYFLYVHPCLPILDQAQFLFDYRHPEQSTCQYSLPLLQAVLCAAAAFVPTDVGTRWGSVSIVSTRNELYQKAKLLYHSGMEKDPLVLAQTTLLLSLFDCSMDGTGSSVWLSLAIGHAKAVKAHQFGCLALDASADRHNLKRLWWCCIVRDRAVSLGMRRPIQITPDLTPVGANGALSLQDLQKRQNLSEVYSYEVQCELHKIFIRQCHLAVIVTDLLMVLYPDPRESLPEAPSSGSGPWEQLGRFELRLSLWHTEFIIASEHDLPVRHDSISLLLSLTSIYYQATRMAMCSYSTRLVCCLHTTPARENTLEYYGNELRDAVTQVTTEISDLIEADLAMFVPNNLMQLFLLPMILWGINLVLSPTPLLLEESTKNLSLFRAMNHFYGLRVDVKPLSVMVKHTLDFIKPKIIANALGASGATPSCFSDFFRQDPQSYWELCLHLERLLADKVGRGRVDDLSTSTPTQEPEIVTPIQPDPSCLDTQAHGLCVIIPEDPPDLEPWDILSNGEQAVTDIPSRQQQGLQTDFQIAQDFKIFHDAYPVPYV